MRQEDWHQSMRGYFAGCLWREMNKNPNIWLLVGDLGYKIFDQIRDDFPKRFINVGAAEQSLLDISVGLALKGKIPFVYSITTFLLYRGFETIRTYINHEKLNVKLIGSGRDKDYVHDGFSHWSEDDIKLFGTRGILNNISIAYPTTKEDIPDIVKNMLIYKNPYYLNLRR